MVDRIPTDLKTLSRLMENQGIATSGLAFYNHAKFLEEERKDPDFLELYGAWVRLRARDAQYDSHVRQIVPTIANALSQEISKDPQKGVCIDASMMLTKILELEGVWCYAAKGALTIESPQLGDPTHFWMVDKEDVAGHVWVVAPPFEIVDIALRNQLYTRGEEKLLPPSLIVEDPVLAIPRADDYLSPHVLMTLQQQYGTLPKDVHLRIVDGLSRTAAFFPSFEVCLDHAKLRYASAGVSVSEATSIHDIRSRQWNGRSAGEIYEEIVRPLLRL
jgi:hypothetical protein